ncbi:MAG: 50S ribosomal protein L29 [Gammaproteobacteria bacterium]|jgi:large subunit ribosomal protein L29|nr:50S ribosomal protein L29 [Gammaproteobacteria bacterium]
MKASEIREKNAAELSALLLELRRKQFNMRMQAGSGQPPRSSDIRETRKDIARIKTIMKQKSGA